MASFYDYWQTVQDGLHLCSQWLDKLQQLQLFLCLVLVSMTTAPKAFDWQVIMISMALNSLTTTNLVSLVYDHF